MVKCAVYVAIGVNLSGRKECLGLWVSENEGAKFWLAVLTELKNRGLEDIFIVCTDGLKGLGEAIEAVYPKAVVQTCVVHQIRNSLAFVAHKESKEVTADLKSMYRAMTREEALSALDKFAEKWDARYPLIAKSWRENWSRIEPMFSFTGEIRKAIYTTNAIESLNMSLRKIIKTRGSFPSEEACLKLLYLGLRSVAKKWTRPIPNWGLALNQFAIMFDDRIELKGLSSKKVIPSQPFSLNFNPDPICRRFLRFITANYFGRRIESRVRDVTEAKVKYEKFIK